MYEILKKIILNPTVTEITFNAPYIAKKAEPGQFVILRVDKEGERIPLTVMRCDRTEGTVSLIFQTVGATTKKLQELNEGDSLADCVGPLGMPTHT